MTSSSSSQQGDSGSSSSSSSSSSSPGGSYSPAGGKAAAAEEMVAFIDEAWTPYHAVESSVKRLKAAGFKQLSERVPWGPLEPNGKYFFTRNASTLVAFAVGGKYAPGNGFGVVGAHTDSPCLKLKPVSKAGKGGYLQVGVQTYGGGLWHTWFDRDLSVAGQVLVRGEGGKVEPRLVKVERPLMRIPTLAIHLDREVNDAFKFNKQTHLLPVLATAIKAQASGSKVEEDVAGDKKEESGVGGSSSETKHHAALVGVLAEELGVSAESIAEFDLCVCDTQPGSIGGAQGEFVYQGRLDNLCSSHAGLAGLISSLGSLEECETVRCLALFDHEEVGSDSAAGAGGTALKDGLQRVVKALAGGSGEQEGLWERTCQNSLVVSADMAHALHPNYTEKHDGGHVPAMHGGMVVKHNANQRYATTPVTAHVFKEVGRRANLPVQEFVVRNDMACGSTIGPILSSGLGMRVVDVGAPQLSMHSVREVMGTDDCWHAREHFRAFYETWNGIDKSFDVDAPM